MKPYVYLWASLHWLYLVHLTVTVLLYSISLSRAGVISLRTPLISPLSSLHCRCLRALSCLPLVPITAPLVSLSDIYTIDMIVLTLNLTRPVSRTRALLLSSTVESLHYTVSDVRAARLHDILLSLPETGALRDLCIFKVSTTERQRVMGTSHRSRVRFELYSVSSFSFCVQALVGTIGTHMEQGHNPVAYVWMYIHWC